MNIRFGLNQSVQLFIVGDAKTPSKIWGKVE